MNRAFRFFSLLFIFLFFMLSCGKKEEEFAEEKTTSSQHQNTDSVKDRTAAKQEEKDSLRTEKRTYKPLKSEITISPLEANDYVGKVVTVQGFVAEVNKREKVAYLNFVENFPENPFTGVIFESKFEEFGDLEVYRNRQVELTGRVTIYKGKPQIILEDKSQVRILEKPKF